jgi:hypothetical protein
MSGQGGHERADDATSDQHAPGACHEVYFDVRARQQPTSLDEGAAVRDVENGEWAPGS